MKSYALFQEYIWLINTIHRVRRISLEEINERWTCTEMSGGVPIARSTFNRHKEAIQDMFGIYIECDRRDGFRYYIGNAEVLEEDTVQNWMLSTMSVSSVLGESRSIHDRILLESIPSSGEHLEGIMDALKRSVRIRVRYRRYGSDQASDMTLDPICVKLFSRRWYALVKFPATDGKFCLALDRITSLEVTDVKSTPDRDFDPAVHFRECYGIVNDTDVPVQRIVLRAFGREVFYLRDLPMHHSQKEIATERTHSDFELTLRPTSEFLSAILAKGAAVKVIEPPSVAEAVLELHRNAVNLYENQR